MAGGLTDDAPATIRTSWRRFVREQVTVLAFVVPVLIGVFWLSGETDLGFLVGFSFATVGVVLLWEAGRYRLFGAAEVRVEPEAVTVVGHRGRVRRVERAGLQGLWLEKRWVIKGRDATVRIRDLGFDHEDWTALSASLHEWKTGADVSALPGISVGTGPREDGAVVYEVHRARLAVGAMAVFALVGVFPVVASLGSYADGTWVEDPFFTLATALGGLALAAYLVRVMVRMIKRIQLGADGMRVETVLGRTVEVPYADVVDVFWPHLDTRQGTFTVDRRNDDVLDRLLGERLPEGQMTGLRWLRFALWFQPWMLAGTVGGGALLWFVAGRLGRAWGLAPAWVDVLVTAVLVAFAAILWIAVRLRARHLLRHADD